MEDEILTVRSDNVTSLSVRLKSRGYRFVTMTCIQTNEDGWEILYSFDKQLKMEHFRLAVYKGETVPSISPVYFAAFLVENEIQDQFGIEFDDLTINYHRTLYLDADAPVTPLRKGSQEGTDRREVTSVASKPLDQ